MFRLFFESTPYKKCLSFFFNFNSLLYLYYFLIFNNSKCTSRKAEQPQLKELRKLKNM